MKTQLLIGIDLGSSSLKALALEAASGRTVALSRMPLQHDRLPGGGCEVGAPMIRSALSSVLRDVIVEISSKRLGCAAVVDDNKGLLGIITDGDLRRMLEHSVDITHIKASDIMTVAPKTIQTYEYAVKALQLMQKNDITQIVVVDSGIVVGFIHIHDLLREGIV